MKRVLVTGAGGFIGRQAIPLLIERGFEVHAVSSRTAVQSATVTWHQSDLLDTTQRTALVEAVRPTHILHFAWIATPGVYWTSPLNETWREATIDLLSLAQAAGVGRFVGAGSSAEYDWNKGHCDEHLTPLVPLTAYGRAKAEAGKAVIDASGISTAWGRVFFLYGPHEYPQRLVPSVILSLLQNEPAKCTHGAQVRDFLYVHDTASAFVSLLDGPVTGAVNIASGIPVTIREVVETVAKQLKKEDLVKFGAITPPANDPPRLTAATDRLYKEVGWTPSHSLQKGIADTIGWWQTQRI